MFIFYLSFSNQPPHALTFPTLHNFFEILENLDDLMEGYYELCPQKRDEKVYLFLDEVQNVEVGKIP